MQIESIGIFGGTGFVGTTLANELAERGIRLTIFTRSRDHARGLWPLPGTEIIETDVYNKSNLTGPLSSCDAVINLAGILNEKRDNGEGFRHVHTELTRTIIEASTAARVKRYLHMSALNADPFGPSHYLRTKGEAENLAMAAHDDGLPTTVFRPSVIFGPADDFFNRFARLLKISPPVLPLACAEMKLQPVYVGDVCTAIIRTLDDRSSFGVRYDLGGPEIKSLIEIVRYVSALTNAKRLVIPAGRILSRIQANVLEYVPGKPFSRDNLRSASEDSICRNDNGLELLDIKPTAINAVVPTYLGGKYARMRYYSMRTAARRDP